MDSRLDTELVTRGLARSRARAREAIESGRVRVGGEPARKASQLVSDESHITLETTGTQWVSRSAEKLLAGLTEWPVPVAGRRCLDVGASTGGFTQVLLMRGAASVTALDVGHDQLHPQVAADPRVTRLDGHSIREVVADQLGGHFDLVVADLSFISLTLVLDRMMSLLADGGDLVVLVKPQFEVGRRRLGRRGVVSDAAGHRFALRQVLDAAARSGLWPHGCLASPVRGSTGNLEYLLWLRQEPSARMDEVEQIITSTLEQFEGGAG